MLLIGILLLIIIIVMAKLIVVILITLEGLILHCFGSDYIPKDWVDPTDMRHYDRHTKSMKQSHRSNHRVLSDHVLDCVTEDSNDTHLREEVKKYEVFVERFINHFLLISDLKHKDAISGTKISSDIVINVSAEELMQLKKFGQHFKSYNLNDLDQIFARMFTSNRGFSFDSLTTYLNPLERILESKEKMTMVLLVVVFSFTLWMFGTGKSHFRIMFFLFLVFFILGLIWNWWYLYQTAVVDQYVKMQKFSDLPDTCKNNFSWWTFIVSLFKSSDDCMEYYRAHKVDPFSQVTPSVVFSDTLSMMVLHPLGKLGTALGIFCSGIIQHMPWPLNMLFLPVLLILVMLFALSSMSLFLNQQIKLWTLLGGFTIGGQRHTSPQVSVDPPRYKVIDNAKHVNRVLQDYSDEDYVLVNKKVVRQAIESVSFRSAPGNSGTVTKAISYVKGSTSTVNKSINVDNNNIGKRSELVKTNRTVVVYPRGIQKRYYVKNKSV